MVTRGSPRRAGKRATVRNASRAGTKADPLLVRPREEHPPAASVSPYCCVRNAASH